MTYGSTSIGSFSLDLIMDCNNIGFTISSNAVVVLIASILLILLFTISYLMGKNSVLTDIIKFKDSDDSSDSSKLLVHSSKIYQDRSNKTIDEGNSSEMTSLPLVNEDMSTSLNLDRNPSYRIQEENIKKSSLEYTRRGTLWSKHASWHLPKAPRDVKVLNRLKRNNSGEGVPQGLEHCNVILNRYSVDIDRGFLPAQDPLQRLPCARYHLWEDLADDLPKLLGARLGQARQPLEQLPVLDIDRLVTNEELIRAHLLLCLFAHAYVWGGPEPIDVIPEGVAKPLWQISEKLGIPPVLGHPSIVLYNWRRLDVCGDICMENLATLNNFFDGRDESWFYLITVEVEAKGASTIVPIMLAIDAIQRFNEEAIINDKNQQISPRDFNSSVAAIECNADGSSDRYLLSQDVSNDASPNDCAMVGELHPASVAIFVTAQLKKVSEGIKGMTASLSAMREGCHPFIFYHRVRPFLSGWKHNPTLPAGVLYKGVSLERQSFYGGSAAQSALLPFLDISLGISHDNVKSNEFLLQMRQYMSASHREFLKYIESVACIKEYINDSVGYVSQNLVEWVELHKCYHDCLRSLESFRTAHIVLVSEYIISQQVNASSGSTNKLETSAGGKGTGGTDLMSFLKPIRDNCRAKDIIAAPTPTPASAISTSTTADTATIDEADTEVERQLKVTSMGKKICDADINDSRAYIKLEGHFEDIDLYRGALYPNGRSHYQTPIIDERWSVVT